MKKILLSILILSLASCGNGKDDNSIEDILSSGDLKSIRSQRAKSYEKQQALEKEIAQIDSVIAALDDTEKLPLVSTLKAQKQEFKHYLELQGDVTTRQNVLIYPEIAGTLQRIFVKEGQRVRKGQVLGKIDDGGLSNQLAQVKTQAELAKTTFERQKRLWEQSIGSEIQYLQAKANYDAQQSAVSQMESQLGKSTLKAPFSGIIDAIIQDQGTVVAPGPGAEIFRIVNLSDMYITVDVPENNLGAISKGKEAKVYFPVLGDTIISKVRQTGNFINASNRAFSVEIPVPNKKGNIKPNLSARVHLNDYSSDNAILVPQGIISENADGEQYVYVAVDIDDNKAVAKRRIIATGKTNGSLIEVISGVTEGDILIKEGARTVKEGQNVQILNAESDD